MTYQRSVSGSGVWTDIGTVSSAPFTLGWSTTTAADGRYALRAVATDASGNHGMSPVVTIRVDNTAPAGSLTAPTARPDGRRARRRSRRARATAGSGISSVRFEWRAAGGTWAEVATVTSAPYSTTWDPTGQLSGAYELRAIVTDAAGNATRAPATRSRSTRRRPTWPEPIAPDARRLDTLGVTTSGGAAKVVYECARAPAAAGSVAGDRDRDRAPWRVGFDPTVARDGAYDIRATASTPSATARATRGRTSSSTTSLPRSLSSDPADGAGRGVSRSC